MCVFEKLILMITSTYFHHSFPFNVFWGAWFGSEENWGKELDIF